MHQIISLFFYTLLPSQICGLPNLTGLYFDTDECNAGTEHVCTVDEWPDGWTAAVCYSMLTGGYRFSPIGSCYAGETPTCGIVPEPDAEPFVCSPMGTDDVYVSDDASCSMGEIHVCTHGDTPDNPNVLVCCVDSDECRFEVGDGACEPGEWLACGHA